MDLPLSDFAVLNSSEAPLARQAPKINITRKTLRYYSGEGIEDEAREVFLSAAIFANHNGELKDDPDQLGSWFYSVLDYLYPGLVRQLLGQEQAFVVRAIKPSEKELRFLLNRPTLDDQEDDEFGMSLFYLEPLADGSEIPVLDEIYGIFSTYVFAMIKRPSQLNLRAFTENRPRALINKAAMNPESLKWLANPDEMPTLDAYLSIHGYFNMRIKEKKLLSEEFIKWVAVDGNPRTEVIAMVAKLWKNSGMTHVLIISDLLRQYADIIVKIPILREEARKFLAAKKQMNEQHEGFAGYSQAIQGDKGVAIYSRNYPELFKIARELVSRLDPRFLNYARGTQDSKLMPLFEAMALDAGAPLPSKDAIQAVGI